MKESHIHLQPITKSEFEFMVQNDILKCINGRYNGLITGSKEKHGRNKSRWVEEPLYYQMLKLQEKLKVEQS